MNWAKHRLFTRWQKIVIGWLFFIVLKCFKMSWTPSPWTKLISLRCTTRLNWLLSLITNFPSLKNPWKANKKIARSNMTLCLSGTVCCKAVKIFCNIDLVMGILESEVFLKILSTFQNFTNHKMMCRISNITNFVNITDGWCMRNNRSWTKV